MRCAYPEWGTPAFSIVSVPTTDTIYYGGPDIGSFKKVGDSEPVEIHVAKSEVGGVTASLSHLNDDILNYIAEHYPDATRHRDVDVLKGVHLN